MRRLLKIFLGLVLFVVLLAGAFFVRIAFFPPHFDVVSIAQTPEYQDAALLARAWALPVAASYRHRLDFQPNGSVCGPTSAANVFRSIHESADTPGAVLDGSGKCSFFNICMGGLTLDELAAVMRRKTTHHISVLRNLSIGAFRQHLARSNDPSRRYTVNFHRGLLFGQGVGHHSPIGGYLEDRDLVFVLDVNAKFGPWLVSTERLFRAVDSEDSSSHMKRGLLLIE
jgi:phytochelatin synthase